MQIYAKEVLHYAKNVWLILALFVEKLFGFICTVTKQSICPFS